MVEEHCQQQLQEGLIEKFAKYSEGLSKSSNIGAAVCPWEKEEEILPLLSEEASGKEVGEEPQKLTTQATNSPLPAPFPDQMHILPKPAAHETHGTPTAKVVPSILSALKNLKKLAVIVETCVTTSNTLAAAHTAWHSGWFGCWFRCGALGHQHFYKLHQFQQPPKA